VVLAGTVSGSAAAVVCAVVAAAAFNFAFIPPLWTFKVDAGEDWVALGVFVAVAITVGLLVAAEADRRRAAEHREAEIRSLYERLESGAEERARLADEASRVDVLERVDEQRCSGRSRTICGRHCRRSAPSPETFAMELRTTT